MAFAWLRAFGPAFLFLSMALTSGCQQQTEPQITPVTESYRLIDLHRTDEAIDLLEKSYHDDPTNAEIRVALASAYAHKAGFRIQALWGVVGAATRNEIAHLNFENQPNHAASRAVGFLRSMMKIVRIIDAVPEVDAERISYAEHAIGLLDGMDQKVMRSSDHVLSALLRLLVFRSKAGWMYSSSAFAVQRGGKCHVSVDSLSDRTVELARILERVTFDLDGAFPKQRKSLQNVRLQLAGFVRNSTRELDSVAVADEAFRAVFKTEVLQAGLGQWVECNQR